LIGKSSLELQTAVKQNLSCEDQPWMMTKESRPWMNASAWDDDRSISPE